MRKTIFAISSVLFFASCEKDTTYHCEVITMSMGNLTQTKTTFTGTKQQKLEYEKEHTSESQYIKVGGTTYINYVKTTCN